jgi:molecular chaperone DnaJ
VLQLDFKEAALGGMSSITLQVQDTCLQCGGSGAQPGSRAPACTMCKGRREIVKRQAMGAPGHVAGT